MKRLPVLVMAGVLLVAGCTDVAPEEAVEEADPGLDVTIEPPAAGEPEVVGEDGEAGDLLPDGVSQECFDALAAAGNETPAEGYGMDAEPLWPAFDACASVEEFSAATESVSGVLGDQDPAEYVMSLCGEITEVQQSALCLDAETGAAGDEAVGGDIASSECEVAVTEGTIFDEGTQTLDAAALEPAFRACDSFDAMASVLTSLPDVPADLDAEAFAMEQCESVEGLADTPVCQSLM